jgi:hypothetical protein
MPGHAVMSEQGVQEGTERAPLRAPVLRISMADVLLTLTTWGQPVRKSKGRCFVPGSLA